MSMSRMIARFLIIALVVACCSVVYAADFVQAERDVDFIKASRRQDASLTRHLGELIHPAGVRFFHLGSFKAFIHRDGLDRALWLIPVKSLPYQSLEEMREAARGNPISIGALVTAFHNEDPEITPGTFVLLYDGFKVRFVDHWEYQINRIVADVEPAPADDALDPVIGTVSGTAYGQANITPAGDLELFVQLTDPESGEPLMDEDGFVKVKITVPVPGIATDDDSPYRDLAEPADEEEQVD